MENKDKEPQSKPNSSIQSESQSQKEVASTTSRLISGMFIVAGIITFFAVQLAIESSFSSSAYYRSSQNATTYLYINSLLACLAFILSYIVRKSIINKSGNSSAQASTSNIANLHIMLFTMASFFIISIPFHLAISMVGYGDVGMTCGLFLASVVIFLYSRVASYSLAFNISIITFCVGVANFILLLTHRAYIPIPETLIWAALGVFIPVVAKFITDNISKKNNDLDQKTDMKLDDESKSISNIDSNSKNDPISDIFILVGYSVALFSLCNAVFINSVFVDGMPIGLYNIVWIILLIAFIYFCFSISFRKHDRNLFLITSLFTIYASIGTCIRYLSQFSVALSLASSAIILVICAIILTNVHKKYFSTSS